jgi:hypothetical protein
MQRRCGRHGDHRLGGAQKLDLSDAVCGLTVTVVERVSMITMIAKQSAKWRASPGPSGHCLSPTKPALQQSGQPSLASPRRARRRSLS